MALGNSGAATDSPVLVVVSAVAIAVVFVLVMLLIILRARHMAYQRQEAMRLREEWETQLILRFQNKPHMHEVRLSSGAPVNNKRLELTRNEWSRLMPLFADAESSEPPTYSIGVLLQLPRPKTGSLSGPELMVGLSKLRTS